LTVLTIRLLTLSIIPEAKVNLNRIAIWLIVPFVLGMFTLACIVESVCYNDADCPGQQVCSLSKCAQPCTTNADCQGTFICEPGSGKCVEPDCLITEDCKPGFECTQGICVSIDPIDCPDDMVPIQNQFCIDIFEASRPDATSTLEGSADSMAMSVVNKKQWKVQNNAEALAACQAAGKTLCSEGQWFVACRGPDQTVYAYGDEYDPVICSGIDKYCNCGSNSDCEDKDPCPYAGCFHECKNNRIIQDPTGSNPGCKNDFGVYDMNGGVWEHVLGGDEKTIRGGAYNCSDSRALHRCNYIPGIWEPSARGFRCCSLGLDSGD